MVDRKDVKTLLEISTDVKKADEIISKYYGFETMREKIAFLKGMFDVAGIGPESEKPDEDTYWAILSSIINAKWN